MRHSDEAYAMMLLTLPMNPGGDSAPKALSGEELAFLAGQLSLSGKAQLSSLLGADVPELMGRLGIGEDEAYRLCTLLDRDMQLVHLMDECESEGIEIVTPFDAAYPELVRRRMGAYSSPALFACGQLALVGAEYVGILGISGIKTDKRASEGVEALCINAAINGFGIVTSEEPGICRAARESALKHDGRLVCALGGSLRGFAKAHAKAIHQGNLLALSQAHPGSEGGAGAAFPRNQLIFALSRAAFVLTSDGRRSEADAARKAGCEHLYAYADEAYALNRSLYSKGFEPVGELKSFDVATKAADWMRPDAEQLRFL